MNFSVKIVRNILIITVSGDLLGLKEELELLEAMEEHIENGVKSCALDISNVGYMNSAGLNIFLRGLTMFRRKDGEVVILNPSERVKNLLVVTKLGAIFKVYYSEEDALKHLELIESN